ncbi:23S rRNA (adenine(2030)-N(6))-methyltransferase RlmJ [Roseomonas sp. OT10]|uniref:23S rRNA (adenine(2030)-N(6))-methyltransferase RlmJ n=1 Tax=Roseomonas cutis TaxID=2897332 RepID=UPI001E53FDE8|nr:23S rRNA (adenine(2030)-N(6))-methyltransferase RlmJ [Roseomonas sp. OT10]UFN50405.1 23S rRNA (adenine(2030)-N(6))-methyltransferase RlmJ [Roseomonas sp. OT10]
MNYRHAYHAGNFADCLKHALVHHLVLALGRKPKPFRVLDAHAGIGRYDLTEERAARTGEWRRGIGRLDGVADGPLAPWLDAVRVQGWPPLYPGSPALVQALLREEDRLVLCELHPEDQAVLRAAMGRDPRVAIHERDGWEASLALTPFPEKRGLLLLDPPFEKEGDFARLSDTMLAVWKRFRGCVQAAWYPVKHRAPVRDFHDAVRAGGLRDVLACELWLREPTDPTRLNGCGLAVVNPPYGFEAAAGAMLAALLERLGDGEPGQGFAVTRLADE